MRALAIVLILLAIALAAYCAWQVIASTNKNPDRPPVNLAYPMYAGIVSVLLAIIAVAMIAMQSWHAIRQ